MLYWHDCPHCSHREVCKMYMGKDAGCSYFNVSEEYAWHEVKSEKDLPIVETTYMVARRFIPNNTPLLIEDDYHEVNKERWLEEVVMWRDLTDIEKTWELPKPKKVEKQLEGQMDLMDFMCQGEETENGTDL